jgi:hypothetical protein
MAAMHAFVAFVGCRFERIGCVRRIKVNLISLLIYAPHRELNHQSTSLEYTLGVLTLILQGKASYLSMVSLSVMFFWKQLRTLVEGCLYIISLLCW